MRTLLACAKEARKIAENIAEKEGFPRDLEGLCARASAVLFELLEEKGFEPEIGVSSTRPHVFVMAEGYIIDVTATQYRRKKKIFVVKAEDAPCMYFPEMVFRSVDELRSYQELVQWMEDQMA